MLFFTFWVAAFAAFLSVDVLLRRDDKPNEVISMACGAVFALIVTFGLFLAATVVPIFMPVSKFYLIAFVAAVSARPLGVVLTSPRPAG